MNKVKEELMYTNILKVEFKDMLEKFLEPRNYFHAYSISRMCTHATMIGFDYGYYTIKGDELHVGKILYLGEYGTIRFEIDCSTNYGHIASDNSNAVINKFLTEYPVVSNITSYTNKIL